MKKILLSSAAIALLAGAASAEISWSGSGTLGYNDDYEDGVYVDFDVDITATQELNNGWTATLTYGFELEDGNGGNSGNDFKGDDNITVTLSNDMFALTYGDTEFAPVSYWKGVSEMATDSFSEQDGEDVLKVTSSYGMVEGGVSGAVDGGDVYGIGLGLKATFGNFWGTVAYQEETDAAFTDAEGDYVMDEVYGVSVGTSFAGADFVLAYSKQTDSVTDVSEDSLGLEVAYPVGPVTLGAFYVDESQAGDTYGVSALYSDGPLTAKVYYKEILSSEEYGLGATYDMGNGLTLTGGYIDGDSVSDNDFAGYVVAEYDLGGGASFLASYADANNAAAAVTDDIDTVTGGYELLSGATLALSLSF
jgi:hypothetical protein